jgi:hypothetical protein
MTLRMSYVSYDFGFSSRWPQPAPRLDSTHLREWGRAFYERATPLPRPLFLTKKLWCYKSRQAGARAAAVTFEIGLIKLPHRLSYRPIRRILRNPILYVLSQYIVICQLRVWGASFLRIYLPFICIGRSIAPLPVTRLRLKRNRIRP